MKHFDHTAPQSNEKRYEFTFSLGLALHTHDRLTAGQLDAIARAIEDALCDNGGYLLRDTVHLAAECETEVQITDFALSHETVATVLPY